MTDRFDEMASGYDGEIPDHIRSHLLEKKTDRMISALHRLLPWGKKGVDLGCGTGHHLRRMAEAGYSMTGLDRSRGMALEARKTIKGLDVEIEEGDITAAPFPDEAFDFAFAINVLHHLPQQDHQVTALCEMARVVKPGGLVLVQDFNSDSLITRLFMNIIFPLTSRIDDGSELWVSPRWVRGDPVEPLRLCELTRFTFLPHFTPLWLFGIGRQLERGLERVSGGCAGAHFLAVMRKG